MEKRNVCRKGDESARVILEPYFIAARDEFQNFCAAKQLGNDVKRTRLEVSSEVRDAERHYAGATVDGRMIAVAPELADLPEDTVAAMLAHEFGHIVDHLYPGRFVIVQEELVCYPEEYDANDSRTGQSRIARMRQWQARSEHEIELTADLIAEQVLGHRIGYSGPCMLQSFNRGSPRPKDLR